MVEFFFFFNDTATTEIYTLSLHDALPISTTSAAVGASKACCSSASALTSSLACQRSSIASQLRSDRKSTRLNSSHANISYAVFCLKKKKLLLISLIFVNYQLVY